MSNFRRLLMAMSAWAKSVYLPLEKTSTPNYSSFYDKDKNPIRLNLEVDKELPIVYSVDIPANAKYIAMSNNNLITKSTIILSD